MRNESLDFFKIIAAFMVVSLHVGSYDEFPPMIGDIIRLAGRWAVPFFFLVTGYFILSGSEKEILNKVNRLLKLFIVANFIYLPLFILKHKGDTIFEVFSFKIIFYGTMFHLWYLSSSIFGLIIFNFLINNFDRKLLIISSFLIFLGAEFYDQLRAFGIYTFDFDFFRFALSIPFIYLGWRIRNDEGFQCFLLKHKYVFLFLGFFLQLISTIGVNLFYDVDLYNRQFQIGVVFVTLGIFSISISMKGLPKLISMWGRNYSYGIYAIHPIFTLVLYKCFDYLDIHLSSVILILSFLFSLFFVIFLDKRVMFIFRILNGRLGLK